MFINKFAQDNNVRFKFHASHYFVISQPSNKVMLHEHVGPEGIINFRSTYCFLATRCSLFTLYSIQMLTIYLATWLSKFAYKMLFFLIKDLCHFILLVTRPTP